MTRRNKIKTKTAGHGETVTCPHCRYERPARDARCHICGYPWPFAVQPEPRIKRRAQNR